MLEENEVPHAESQGTVQTPAEGAGETDTKTGLAVHPPAMDEREAPAKIDRPPNPAWDSRHT